MTLSAIIITKNEEANIADCLATLTFCDEVIVVDGGSEDHTVEIARAAGAKVTVDTDWQGFGIQKQRALDLASGSWVLSVDADERIPPALADEIRIAINNSGGDKFQAYTLNRKTMFLGKFLRHGGWHPDHILRLAKTNTCRFSADIIHEAMLTTGTVGKLHTPFTHHSYTTIEEVLSKLTTYTVTTAQVRRTAGKRGGLTVAIAKSIFVFIKCYFIRGGLLDGTHGFVAAVYRAHEIFWRTLAVGWEQQ